MVQHVEPKGATPVARLRLPLTNLRASWLGEGGAPSLAPSCEGARFLAIAAGAAIRDFRAIGGEHPPASPGANDVIPLSTQVSLLKAAVGQAPSNDVLRARLASALLDSHRYAEAAQAYAEAAACGADDLSIPLWAQAHLLSDRADLAEQVCLRGLSQASTSLARGLRLTLGLALMRLNKQTEAKVAFLGEIQTHGESFEALEALMAACLAQGGRAELAEALAQVPKSYTGAPLMRAYGALEASLRSSTGEARTLMSLAGLHQLAPPVPYGFASLSAWNERLVEEIQVSPHLHTGWHETFQRTDRIGGPGEPALQAFKSVARDLIKAYLGHLEHTLLLSELPPFPEKTAMHFQANIVRGDQPHRAHIHKYALVSGVYHVSIPPDNQGRPHAGALVVGSLDGLVDGHVPAWPVEVVVPQAGVATIFPPHIFHSVNAMTASAPRVAIAFDLVAA